MRVAVVLGTRPEIMKNHPIVKALRGRGIPVSVLHTNQQRVPAMHAAAFADFGYGPDVVLDATYAIGRAIDWVRDEITRRKIDLVLVNGDTAAALVGAVAAVYSDVGLAHVEAGLRSFDAEMYEERNRIMVDAAAHFLFTYTAAEKAYLEGIPDLRGRIVHVGNTTVDVIEEFGGRLLPPQEPRYAFVTLHRKELTDRPAELAGVLRALADLRGLVDRVIFPVHPRTRDVLERHGLPEGVEAAVDLRDPLPPLRALAYEKHAALIVTDSGCVQEEAYLFGVPCVTVRQNTERRATVELGANIVCGYRHEDVIAACRTQLAAPRRVWPPIYGETGVGERIADSLLTSFRDFRSY